MRWSTHLSKRTKEHYDQQGKNDSFFIGHRYGSTIQLLMEDYEKKLCSLWHGPLHFVKEANPTTFRETNNKGKKN